jgi:hypothetical protein
VPAESSSSIPAALAQLAHTEALQEAEAPHLLAYPRHHPRPTSLHRAAASAHRHPRAGRRRSPHRGQVHYRDRRVGCGCSAAGPGRAGRPPGCARPLFGAGRGHDPPDADASGCRRLGGHDRHVAGRPGGSWAAATGGRGRRQDAVGLPTCWPAGPPAGGDGAHPPTRCWRNARSMALPARFLDSSRCWPTWSWPRWSSPPMRSTPTLRPRSSSWPPSTRTT